LCGLPSKKCFQPILVCRSPAMPAVVVADVGNAYLNADCREKLWTIAGPEFGTDTGKVMFVKKALYGLKSLGAAWCALFSNSLTEMNF
jgi:hypothetical protein